MASVHRIQPSASRSMKGRAEVSSQKMRSRKGNLYANMQRTCHLTLRVRGLQRRQSAYNNEGCYILESCLYHRPSAEILSSVKGREVQHSQGHFAYRLLQAFSNGIASLIPRLSAWHFYSRDLSYVIACGRQS